MVPCTILSLSFIKKETLRLLPVFLCGRIIYHRLFSIWDAGWDLFIVTTPWPMEKRTGPYYYIYLRTNPILRDRISLLIFSHVCYVVVLAFRRKLLLSDQGVMLGYFPNSLTESPKQEIHQRPHMVPYNYPTKETVYNKAIRNKQGYKITTHPIFVYCIAIIKSVSIVCP